MRNEYHLNRMTLYGQRHLCGGPRTACWDVDDGEPPSVTLSMMCLVCGDGDPSYQPAVESGDAGAHDVATDESGHEGVLPTGGLVEEKGWMRALAEEPGEPNE